MKRARTILIVPALLLTFIVTKQLNVMQDTQEIWKDVVGYEGLYQVSNFGKVRSVVRVVKHTGHDRRLKSVPIKGAVSKRGYPILGLSVCGVRKNAYVHKLVAIAFIPNPFGYVEINHINGIKTDNRSSNLEWCSRAHNLNHAIKNGLYIHKKGTECWSAILDETQVKTIKICLRDGLDYRLIAKYFKVGKQVIQDIKHNRTWRSVSI